MAYDIVKGHTTPTNWSRGHDVGSVGMQLMPEGKLGKTLMYGAAAGAGAVFAWLMWKGHRSKPKGRRHETMIFHTSKSGRLHAQPLVAYYGAKR